MTDLNKEREAFEEAYLSIGGKQRDLELEDGEYTNSKAQLGWELWQIKAKAQAVPVWVSTEFMLPDDNDYVDILINGKRRIVDAVYLDGKFFIFPPFSKEQWTEVNNKVTHWMPRVDVVSQSGAEG